MPRRKLSEYRSKLLLAAALEQPIEVWEVDADNDYRQTVSNLNAKRRYVIKVDQAVKGRFKKGLVKLNRTRAQLAADIGGFAKQGYRFMLIEPFIEHANDTERYLAVERTRDGNRVTYSSIGGVDIENVEGGRPRTISLDDTAHSPIDVLILKRLLSAFDDHYMSFMELNPFVVRETGSLLILDAAVEVDDQAQLLLGEDSWKKHDLRNTRQTVRLPQETAVAELNNASQASMSLEVINPDGRLFLLLSGGGASVVIADEIASLGYGKQLANYGEYSGNPNYEETLSYASHIISLMLASKAKRKRLLIGGGVANFTDIRTTFTAIIAALRRTEKELRRQQIKVFVRRGGPHEAEGLAIIRDYLETVGLLGTVNGPEQVLSEFVRYAAQEEEE